MFGSENRDLPGRVLAGSLAAMFLCCSQAGIAQTIDLRLTPVYEGLIQPVFLTHAGDGSGRVFIIEQQGVIRVGRGGVLQDEPFLWIPGAFGGQEQGLLGLAFAPDFVVSGQFYVNFTENGQTYVSRFRVSEDDPNRADLASRENLLVIGQPFTNHNGGWIDFGPDGYLYVATGDGGSANDPDNHAQRLDSLLGKILRIDVSGETIAIPPDNPFVGTPVAQPAIWAYGLRNPWRASFDRLTGDLWIADVGQGAREEVNVQQAGVGGGQNYGWRMMEGSICQVSSCSGLASILPVTEYNHSLGCSVTGGYVYRGALYPNMQGRYLFSDYCSGRIFALNRTGSGYTATSFSRTEVGRVSASVSSFGEDQAGNLYLVGHNVGRIFLLSDGDPISPGIGADISGTWYDPQQDGHGWLIEAIEVNGEPALLAAWYTYLDGEPVWMMGVGSAVGDRIEVPLTITRGGSFTPGFDPDAVIREHWGEASFHFPGGDQAGVEWTSSYPGFSDGGMPLFRLVQPAPLEADPPQGISACHSGAWYQPSEDGHGLQVQVFGEPDERQLLVIWYAYLEGEQRWMIGQGPITGDTAVATVISADGTGFPPDFDPAAVQRRAWGTLSFTALGPDNARIVWESEQPGFGNGSLDLIRLTSMLDRKCNPD